MDKSKMVSFRFDEKLNTFIAYMPNGDIIPMQQSIKIEDAVHPVGGIYVQEITIKCLAYFDNTSKNE